MNNREGVVQFLRKPVSHPPTNALRVFMNGSRGQRFAEERALYRVLLRFLAFNFLSMPMTGRSTDTLSKKDSSCRSVREGL